MIFDIKSYAEQLCKTIKVKVSLFSEDGKLVFGDSKDGEGIIPNFIGVKKDKNLDRILFSFKYHNIGYLGVIPGNTEENYNYAVLFVELFENYVSKSTMLSKEDFFRSLILGELDENRIKKYLIKYNIANEKSCVLLISCQDKAKDVMEVVNSYSSEDVVYGVLLDQSNYALIRYIDNVYGEYHSANEFATYLVQSIYEELGIKPCVDIGGAVDSLVKISVSFSQAEDTKRMRQTMQIVDGIHSFKEFILLDILEELPVNKLNEFYNLLTDYNDNTILNDLELTGTAEKFLENSLNVSETARKLYLHRNTLNYRLDKIQNETGLDVRNFSDALTFKLIMILKNLLK